MIAKDPRFQRILCTWTYGDDCLIESYSGLIYFYELNAKEHLGAISLLRLINDFSG